MLSFRKTQLNQAKMGLIDYAKNLFGRDERSCQTMVTAIEAVFAELEENARIDFEDWESESRHLHLSSGTTYPWS